MSRNQRLIGYIWVSRTEQNVDLQLDAMQKAGCAKVFQDKVSGIRWQRKGLDAAMACVRRGDKLTVWRIDRLGRSIIPILTIIEQMEARGASVLSLSEGIDTATENGQLQAIFLAVVAQMEHSAIRRRTQAGVDAAKSRGKRRGGKPKMTKRQAAQAKVLMRTMSAAAVAARFNVGRATVFRHVRASAHRCS